MLASITPLGERARGGVWWRTTTAYVLASTAGGAAMGSALGALGDVLTGAERPQGALALTAGCLALAAAVVDARGRPPSIRRQVDERWLAAYRDWVYGAGFGAQLGLGAVTIVTSASTYLTWALELLTASPTGGLVVGTTFGAVRALPLTTFRAVADVGELRRRHRRWQSWLPVVRRATVAGQAIAAVVLLCIGIATIEGALS
jgi:hypothetical protein